MWQKDNRKYHFILNAEVLPDGRMAQTICGHVLQVRHQRQDIYPLENKCGMCSAVARLINGSVDDARYFLKTEKSLKVISRALELTKSVTLTKMLETKIRKLEKVM